MPAAGFDRSPLLLAVLGALLVLTFLAGPSGAGAATLTVTSSNDGTDSNPGNGVCQNGAGNCTLRGAVQEANATAGADTIRLPTGVYELEIPTINDDLPETGDYDVHSPITFTGERDAEGRPASIIDGGFPREGAAEGIPGLDRLFEIHPTAGNVSFRDVVLQEAYSAADGGAIQNWSSGLLRLDNVHVEKNLAQGAGGGINNGAPVEYEWLISSPMHEFLPGGRVEIRNSVLSGNGAGGGGAAVNNTGTGSVSFLDGTKVVDNPGEMVFDPQDPPDMVQDPDNPGQLIVSPDGHLQKIPAPGVYEPDSSAITNEGAYDSIGTIRIADSTVADNWTNTNGAGVSNERDGEVIVERSQITGNSSPAAGAGIYTNGGDLTVTKSTIAGNLAHDGGGIYSNGSSTPIGLRPDVELTETTIEDNEATAGGGGLANGGDAHLTLTDVDVTHNRAGDAGGGFSTEGRSSLEATRVVVADNETHDEGGGAYVGSERLATIRNSEFALNDAGTPEPLEPFEVFDPFAVNIAGGGGLYTEGGPADIERSTFTQNTSSDEGGALSIDNFGDVALSDSDFLDNRAGTDGGAIENSGFDVTFDELLVKGNRAELDGGGIYNSSSGPFLLLNTTVERNSGLDGGGIANAPDNDAVVRGSLFLKNTARPPGMGEDGDIEDGGHGGGYFSLADGDSKIENTTLSGNVAATAGGGVYHDADGELQLNELTIWRNSAPQGGGLATAESDFVPEVPPKPNKSVILRNTIVGGSLKGGSCDWFVSSDGGNIDTGGMQEIAPTGEGPGLPPKTECFPPVSPTSDSAQYLGEGDRREARLELDAIADNGGPTLTHALRHESLAVDSGLSPCSETDQRGVTRPQHDRCDTGAYEFVGPPQPADDVPPETEYLSGPIQDTPETTAFRFTGSDDKTATEDLMYECRLVENELTEEPEPLAPWDPVPPELMWASCSNPWQAPLTEEGEFEFQVRAIDRAGNVDPTPDVHRFGGDFEPPNTIIAEKPPATSPSRTATFTFSGVDNRTPPQFMEYECRVDSRDPEMWLECFNPTIFSNLTSGEHTIEVRAYDGAENMDPTPARYTWTVGQLPTCDQANITLTAAADGWVDQANPLENYLFETELTVRSGATGDPTAVPPEPVVGENARSLFRFALPNDAPDCELESARLRLYNASPTPGRTLEAVQLAETWKESTLNWSNQPPTRGSAVQSPVSGSAAEGYQEWDVTGHVQGMIGGAANHGWQIRDASENDPEGEEQEFISREMPQDPPPATLPQLVLKYEADTSPPPPPPAEPAGPATEVHCGQVIRESIKVANDLFGCPGEGLVIGASNIVLDLNGHTIHPPATFVDPGEEEGLISGIRNSGNTNVVIRNGTVRGYGYGVLLTGGTTRNVVEGMTLDGNLLAGIELNDADDGRNGNTIRDNTLINNGEAAISFINGAENSVITGNKLLGNGGVGFQMIEAHGHRFENNYVNGVPLSPLIDSDAGANLEGSSDNVFLNNEFSDFGDAGIIMTAGSHRNRVEDNTLVRSGDGGVSILDSTHNQVIGNLAHGSSDGGVVLNQADNTVIRGNDVRFNPSGVEASNSNDILIEENDASDSLQTGLEIGNGVGIRILNNVANRTGGAGVSMEGGAFDSRGNPVGGAVIRGNTANENAESGINVADGGHRVADNRAYSNAGWGIVAGENPDPADPNAEPPLGANIDGGGNQAGGNGESEQCSGVVCDTSQEIPPLTGGDDLVAPDSEILTTPANPTAKTSATFTFTGTDDRVPPTALDFECRVDAPPDPPPPIEEPDPEPPTPGEPPEAPEPPEGAGWIECSSPFHVQGLSDGPHHFEVRALDRSDNFDLTPARYDWEVDLTVEDEEAGSDSTPPETRIASGPSGLTESDSASFSFAGSDNLTQGLNLTFECSLDGAPFTACTNPSDYADLAVGPHTFEVRAIDRQGNRDPSPASRTWTIEPPEPDTTPPETSIDPQSLPDHTTTLRTANFSFSSDEQEATFECSLDGAPWDDCASPKDYSSLPSGMREFRVRAIDRADNADPAQNTDPSPATFSWVIGSEPVPGHVFCGQKITRSIIVQNDLVDCLWDGLVIGAPGITIDLNGHTIDGKGVAAGIRNDGHDHVTIKNGKVADYDYGVMLNPGTEKNVVESMTLEQNQEAAIGLGRVPHPTDMLQPLPPEPPPSFQSHVKDNILRNNDISANDRGIWLTHQTTGTLVRHNTLAANSKHGIWIDRSHGTLVEGNEVAMTSGPGVGLNGANNNTVLDNELNENGGGVLLDITREGSIGLMSTNNRVEKNTITESGDSGVEVLESNGNQILDNVAQYSNGAGVSLYRARDTVVHGNDVRNNKSGLSLIGSSQNRLEANNASNSMGTGIALEADSISNVIKSNTSNDNDGDGLYVGDETSGGSGMWIEGNTTSGNKGYGIYVPKVSHTIKANIANDNGGWGIWASAGSNGRVNIDGGGNKAMGNMGPLDPFTLEPLQCFTVHCDGGPAPQSDAIAPNTFLIEGPANPSTDGVEVFRFDGSDNASTVTFQCRLDGVSDEEAWAPCTSPAEYHLPVGEHTFEVRAVDLSGNVDLTPAKHTWWVDPPPPGVPPAVSIDSGPDPTTVATDARFEFSSSEGGAKLECSLDGAGFTSCSSPKAYSGLAVGQHEFRVRATDSEGNFDIESWRWRVTAPPVTTEVSCGEILTRSTRVTNDLLDCPENGLIIGANNITVDLDGHIVDGVGLGAGIMNPGFDSVTITNGTIHEFDHGVQLNPGTGLNIVSKVRAELNHEVGIVLADADAAGQGNTIRENHLNDNALGVALYSGTRNALVRDNEFVSNSQDGILVELSNGARLEANEIVTSSGAGIRMYGGGDHTVLENELMTNGDGIVVGEELLPTNNTRIESNHISEGVGGITINDSASTAVLYNTVTDLLGTGVVLDLSRDTLVRGNDLGSSKGGVELSESHSNRIEANDTSGTLGTGIEVGELSYNNQVINNSASSNSGEGISVSASTPFGQGNLLEANTADGNGGDGIALDGVGQIVKDNSASVNGGWGIYAAVGAVDRGGNYAAGNAEPAQCYNVVCTSGPVPGEPETWIVDGPPKVSNSRNASFTYNGSDTVTPLHELVFECRIDSDDPFAWEDCDYPAEFLNLSPGQHTFEVRAIDLLGAGLPDSSPAKRNWTYEPLPPNEPPEITLDMKPPAETWQLDAIFTFEANEPDVSFECQVDQFGWEPCGFESAQYMARGAYEWGLEETQVGPHTFRVRATDVEGNVGQLSYTWRLLGVNTIFTDGPGFTPPEDPFEPATGGPTASPNATIDFESNVADATFECSLDLEAFTPCTPPVTYTGLQQGEHLLRVVATDSQGTSQVEASEYEWEVVEFSDTTPPDTSIERAPANNSSSTKFEFAGTDDFTPPELLRYECRLDSTSELDWQECANPHNLLDFYTYEDPEMGPGQHTFEVRAIDAADPEIVDPNNPNFEGNPDPTPARHTWTMAADTTPPGTGITSGPPAKIGEETEALVEFFGNDNASPDLELTFECSVDGAAWEACGSPESFTGLPPGSHTTRIRAVDLAGNFDPTPATRTWEVVGPPVTEITSGPPGQIIDGGAFNPPSESETAPFTFEADQSGSTFECSLDGAEFVPCSSPKAYFVVENGTHELEVRATNPEGVIGEPATYEWAVELGPDGTRPDTRITSGPRAVDSSTVATFQFTGSDNRTAPDNLVFECALDGTAYSSCTSPEQFSDLTRGQHVLLVRARDAAGNFDDTPARYEWTVESPPVATILSGPGGGEGVTDSTNATFTFASDVPGSTFECWLDGQREPCTSPKSYSDLEHGDHLFAVLATAPGGTTAVEWAEYEWTIGHTEPPITTIESGPDIESESRRAEFVFSADQPGVEFLCSLDGGSQVPCESPRVYPRVGLGEHTFEVTAVHPPEFDRFGELIEPLYEPVTATYRWTVVDNVPPDTTIDYGPQPTTASLEAYFGFSTDEPGSIIECSLDFGGFSECEVPYALEDLPPGDHTLHARAVDEAGNVDPTPAMYRWTITRSSPNTPTGTDVTVDLPIPNGPGTGTLNFFEVSLAGTTTIDALGGGPSMPPGYGQPGDYLYDISTSAEFNEPVELCLPYDPADFDGAAARLLTYDGSTWIDVTTSNNPHANPTAPTGEVCGAPEDFTIFAIAGNASADPLASIISGPPLVSESGSATFEFIADRPDAVIQCSLDGLPFEHCESPKTYTHLEPGSHTFVVQAVSFSGTPPLVEPIPYEWEVVLPPDTTPPDTRIVKGPPALTADFEVGFEFTGTDDQSLPVDLDFECLLDGVLLGSCDSVLSTPGSPGVPEIVEVLAAGTHTFEVRAIDDFGNVDPTPARWTWRTIDLHSPETSIDLGPEEETDATIARFEFSGYEELTEVPVFDFECSLDGADFTRCTSPHMVEGLTVGPHNLQVRAVGEGGVVDLTPEIYEWLVLPPLNGNAPDTFFASTPGEVSGPDTMFGLQSDVLVEEFECSLDGEQWSGCDAALELQGLTAGDHTLRARAMTIEGAVDPSPVSHTWTVVGEPDTTILTGPEDPTSRKSATFTFTSDQPDATFRCSVDGSPWVPCTSPFVAGPLTPDTEHTLEVQAMNRFHYLDGERVVDPTPAEYSWTVQDTEPPDTTIESARHLGPTDLVEPNSLEFTFTGTDNGTAWFELGFECSLDGGPWEGCDRIHYLPLEDLPGGDHELHVRAVDDFGNVDPTPAVHTFATDFAPETTILNGPEAETGSTEATFTFEADRSGATFECSLDAAPFAPCPSPVTFTDVPYGEHELEVRARGAGGALDLTPATYSWVSGDMTPPVVTITNGPDVATTDTSATFEFSANEEGVSFQCSLDGGPLTFCESPKTYEDLLAGPHTLEVNATKPHLLVDPVPTVWEWTVEDRTDPETTIESGPEAEVPLDTPALFTFASNEADASFECALDPVGVPQYTECAGPLPNDNSAEFTGLEAGEHTLLVRAVDPSENFDQTAERFTWTVVGPASTTFHSGPPQNGSTMETSATFEFSANQPGVTFTCELDGLGFTPCASGVTYHNLSFETHTLEVRSTNRFGLVEEPPATYEWTVGLPLDAEPPETTIDTGPADLSTSRRAEFTFSSDQALSSFRCSLDGASFAPCESPLTYEGLDEGEHTLAVRAVNRAGTPDPTPAEYAWTVDLEPETFIDTHPQNPSPTTTALFDFSSNEPGAEFECALDMDTFSSCPASVQYTDLATGSHELRVRAVDSTGNPDPTPEVFRWTIGGPPETIIVSAPDEATELTTAHFVFDSNRPDVEFECALDEAAENLFFQPCDRESSFADLGFGEHVLLVRARDAAGTVDPTPAEYEWQIGGVPPPVRITSAPDATTESRTATFEFSATGSNLRYECSLDGVEFSPCTSPKTYNGVPLGPHTFEVRVFDPNALIEAPVSSHEWTVTESVPPDTTIDFGPPPVTANPDGSGEVFIAFMFSSDDPLATFECALDGEAWESCESPAQYSSLTLGDHLFRVRAVDRALNIDASPAEYRFKVVATPETFIDVGPEAEAGSTSRFAFSSNITGSTFECSLDLGPWEPCDANHEFTGLTDGEHVLEVRAISPQGIVDQTPEEWSWVVEAGPPDTAIETGPAASTTSTTASFTFSSNEPEVTYECSLDGAPFVECQAESEFVHHTIEFVSPGDHVLRVRAVDGEGFFDQSPASYGWTVVTPPQTTIDSAPNQETDNTSAGFEFSSDRPGSFECSLDGAPFSPCESPKSYNDLAQGFHNFAVRAIDDDGHVDPTPASHGWRITPPRETEPPDTSIDVAPPATTADTTAEFRFSASELGVTFECDLDGAGWEPCEWRTTYTDLAAGDHELLVRATDAAGNVELEPASHAWRITGGDGIPPETLITFAPPIEGTTGRAEFRFQSSEPGSTFQCSLNGAAFADCSSPVVYSDLPAGDLEFMVRAIDAAGNVDPSPAHYLWTVLDTTPPETEITAHPTDPSDPDAVSFEFTGTDNPTWPPEGEILVLDFECSLDGSSFSACDSPESYQGLSAGQHTFEVRAVDPEGNVDPTPETYTWNVNAAADQTPPQTTIDSGPPATTQETSASFNFSSTEGGSTFECSLDGADYAACESPKEYADLAPGPHELRVKAMDEAGNLDETPASYAWTILPPPDNTAPETTIDQTPPTSTESTSASFRFSSDEPGSTFECALDGNSFNSCSSPRQLTALSVGDHEFQVRAVDAAGNVDETPASYSWTVLGPPETTILNGPDAITASTEARFTFTSDHENATFECALDGAGFVPCESRAPYTGLAQGTHQFEVRARTAAGTLDPTPASYDWEIGDMTPPVVSILDGPPQPPETTTSATANFTLSVDDPDAVLQCSLDGAPLAICEEQQQYTNLAAGDHTLEVTAVKQHLLVDVEPVTWTWTVVDETAPETTIDSGPDPEIPIDSPAAFAFSSNEQDARFECRLDGAAFIDCASPPENTTEFNGLQPGEHRLRVRAVDPSGNTDPTPALHTWRVIGAPVTTIDSAPTDPSGSTTARFEFSADQADVTFECSLDGAAVPNCASPQEFRGLAEGDHEFQVRATNAHGLVEEPPASYTWTVAPIDTTAPQTTIRSAPQATTVDTTARFEFTSNDPTAEFECALDPVIGQPVSWSSCEEVAVFEGLLIGPHELRVRATDPANGTADATPARHQWTIEAPQTTIDSGPTSGTHDAAATFRFSSNVPNPNPSFECSLDGELLGSCVSPHELTGLAPGSHEFEVRALNGAGEPDPTPASYQWTIVPLPETTITSAPTDPTENRDASFEFSSDLGVSFECALDDAAVSLSFAPCDSPKTYENLAVGDHTFLVRAVDADGDVDPTPAEHEWEIGGVPPPVTIHSGPDPVTESRSATFEFSADGGAGLTYECARDSGGWAPCDSPKTYTGLAMGPHTFHVRVFHPNPVEDAPITTYEWTIADLTAPDTAIAFGPPDPSDSATATFALGSNDPSASFECSLDGAPYEVCPVPMEYTGLGDGLHTLDVRAVDPAGNADPSPATWIWTVNLDTTAPETTLHTKPPATTSLTEGLFSFSSDEGGVTFECSLDSEPFAPCDTPYEFADLTTGEHRFRVRAVDLAGNADRSPATHVWTIENDTTAPDTTIVEAPAASTPDNAASFRFSASEPDATFECSLDGEAFEECLAAANFTELAPGEHTLEVRAIDLALNADPTPASHTWTVADPNGPNTTIHTGPPAETTNLNATFTFSAGDPEADLECSLDGAPFESCSSPEELTELPAGDHVFEVRATDQFGNVEVEPARYAWTIIGPPDTIIDSAPDSESTEGGATFEFSATEPDATFECRIDGQAFEPCESPKTYRDLADGDHIFEVRAIGADGLRDETPAIHEWTAAIPPQTTILFGPDATTQERTAGFAFSAGEQGATFECSVDGGAFAECLTPHVASDLTVGEHRFEVQAIDLEGNVDPTPAVYTWTVVPDTTAPETNITEISGGSVVVSFAGSDNVTPDGLVAFECRVDGDQFAPCTSPQRYDLGHGDHTFEVRAVDEAGNVDPSPASHSWTVDGAAPETSIDAKPGETTSSTDASFEFSADEQGSTFECSRDGEPFAPCDSPKRYSDLSAGEHSFEVRATDGAGNTDSSPASHTWTVDATAPETTIGATPSSPTESTDASFEFSADEQGASFECSRDGASFTACSSPKAYSGLTTGEHRFEVRATDRAGNTDPTPDSYTWTVQPPAPSCSPATESLGAAADTWVNRSAPSQTYGDGLGLRVDSGTTTTAFTLVRFELPPIPAGCELASAQLRLYASSHTADRKLRALRIAEPWSESDATWRNRPATTGTAAQTGSGSGSRRWNVISQVQSMYAGSNHGFLVRDSETSDPAARQTFLSTERATTNVPKLVLVFE